MGNTNVSTDSAKWQKNLAALLGEEERVRTASMEAIVQSVALNDHLSLMHEVFDVLVAHTRGHRHASEDELAIQLLGIRMANTLAASLKLGLSGYYQTALHVARDVLELTNLLDYFLDHPEVIEAWRKSAQRERSRDFGPAAIRKALDERDGLSNRKREHIYKVFSEYAAHASPAGARMIAPEGRAKMGPFFDAKLLDAFLSEIALRYGFAALVFALHLDDVSEPVQHAKLDYMTKLQVWRDKYLPKVAA
ncbi:MAG TPA: hypothetical protein VN326_07240 [Casimicrobiaceae bacterium]|nr:hypothetical protein [Casimicrobiaceae bacterium]